MGHEQISKFIYLIPKLFAEITYQWISVTQPLLQQPHFVPWLFPPQTCGIFGLSIDKSKK
jgi:hypothetical protein